VVKPYRVATGISVGILAVAVAIAFPIWGCSKSSGAEVEFGQPLTTPEQFAKVINTGRPVLVDFYATWCGPCKMLAPVLAELEQQYQGRVDFYRVDVDQAKALASQQRIKAIPTVLLYRNGKLFKRFRGFQNKKTLIEDLNALLAQQ